MAFDEDPDDPRPRRDLPLPPEDRLWRHPSELGAVSSAAPAAPEPTGSRRPTTLPLLAGACLAGALVAAGAMWFARPTTVVERERPAVAGADTRTSATFVAADALPTEALGATLAPTVARLQVRNDDGWTGGSALRIDDDGTLATALPLIDGAQEVVLIDHDGTTHAVEVVGVDPATGIAALAAPGVAPGPVAAVAERPDRAGQQAALIGAPGHHVGGSDDAVTVASVTVRATSQRAGVDDLVLHDALQLDRPVPPDAVGGAVVDVDGALLGMVVGNATEGTGLAAVIAGPTLVDVVRDLRDRGEVERAWLGVRATDLDHTLAGMLQVPGGTRLTEVSPDSPAERAGLQEGDVVTAVAGEPLDDASALVLALRSHRPGDTVVIEARRGDQDLRLTATLG